jgi:hypothetical protein
MAYNNANYSKTTFQADIKRKQAMFNRFKKRYTMTTNPTERRWIKTEATRVAIELNTCAKRWATWGYGPNNWIIRNYTMTCFTYGNTPTTRRTTARPNMTNRTCNTRTTTNYWNRPTTNRRPRTRRTTRTRTTGARTTYCAW